MSKNIIPNLRRALAAQGLTGDEIDKIIKETSPGKQLKYEVFLTFEQFQSIRKTFPEIKLTRPGYAMTEWEISENEK